MKNKKLNQLKAMVLSAGLKINNNCNIKSADISKPGRDKTKKDIDKYLDN